MILSASSGLKSEVGGSQLRFFIVRSARRQTMQLSVGVRGVEVRAPAWVPVGEIEAFVHSRALWIERAVREAGVLKPKEDVFLTGGSLFVLGETFELERLAFDGGKPCLEEMPNGWRIQGDRDAAYRLIVKWYKLKADKVFSALLAYWSERMVMPVPGYVVKDQQRLWGSYSGRTKMVNLNWRMISFPPHIIEYVVIHELCHSRHLHHGRSFWEEVSRYCPGWRERRLWLRTSARKYLFG